MLPSRAQVHVRAEVRETEAVAAHRRHGGKMQTLPKCPIHNASDFALWYTPGVADACRAIQADPALVFELTNRGNLVAVISDGSRVLGLGDIGPEAGLPVMEGKCLLLKYLGGVDAVALCLAAPRAEDLVAAVMALAPSFGAVNLEDIAQPKCFRVLAELRRRLSIPVWHDDQQGTAVAALAGAINAMRVTDRELGKARIAMIGAGAANVANYHLLKLHGVPPGAMVMCDSKGILHPGRKDIEADQARWSEKWRICRESNAERRAGGIAEAMEGADLCLAFSASGPGVIRPEWVATMAPNPAVFACANPMPEIWPLWAREAGARVAATGRNDFPNQVNNALVFPGVFRGVLDVRASAISDGMALAAAHALADYAVELGLSADRILPAIDDCEAHARVAVAVGVTAAREGLARRPRDAGELHASALATIASARAASHAVTALEARAPGTIRPSSIKGAAPDRP